MNHHLRESYSHCHRVTRRAASSFYYSFYLLPKPQRDSMSALYAFLRKTDDIADDEIPVDEKRSELESWQAKLDAALQGDTQDPVMRALVDTIARYEIPLQYFRDAVDGAKMDLDVDRYETFEELNQYCYRAASVVGLACLRIWGCTDPRAEEPAIKCGLAFQLTNIIRDVAEDAARGRIYLPLEDLRHFGCSEKDILSRRFTDNVAQLISFEANRAQAFYVQASSLESFLPRDGRRAWRVMMATYRELLDELWRRKYNIFGPRVQFSRFKRLRLVLRGLFSSHTGWLREGPLPDAASLGPGRSA